MPGFEHEVHKTHLPAPYAPICSNLSTVANKYNSLSLSTNPLHIVIGIIAVECVVKRLLTPIFSLLQTDSDCHLCLQGRTSVSTASSPRSTTASSVGIPEYPQRNPSPPQRGCVSRVSFVSLACLSRVFLHSLSRIYSHLFALIRLYSSIILYQIMWSNNCSNIKSHKQCIRFLSVLSQTRAMNE